MSVVSPAGPQAAIIGFSIRFRGIVIALACILVAYGLFALRRAKYDVFPEFAPPQVSIQTEAVGLTPEQVEVLVTRPIENAVNGMPGVQALTLQLDPGRVRRHRFLRLVERYLSRPASGRRTPRRRGAGAAAGRRAADHDAAHVIGQQDTGHRPDVGHALADGIAHNRRLDGALALSRRARRRQRHGVRRRKALDPDQGSSRRTHPLRPDAQ